jgi:probable rRNA maturation factor
MNIVIKNFQKRMPIQTARIKEIARRVLREEKAGSQGEITFCFVNACAIREINLNYLGRNLATDVIAFNLGPAEAPRANFITADILISTDAACSNSRIFKTSPRQELFLYIIHGLLHILGYNDENKSDRALMQQRQERLLFKCLSKKAKR